MNALLRHAMLAACVALLLVGCSTRRTEFPVQHYVPINEDMEPLGELHLSNTLMRLTALEGEMKLQYVGQMPEAAGEDLAGASVYRVKNWKSYFKANAGRKAYCAEAPRWVAVNSKTGAHAWSNEIVIALLTLKDWSKFSPVVHHSCAAGSYVRARD